MKTFEFDGEKYKAALTHQKKRGKLSKNETNV